MKPEAVAEAALRLCRRAEESGWSGPDIYDALGARWPGPLVGGRRRRQALIQLHARFPLDLRPLSRRSHARIVKALALFAMADLRLAGMGIDRSQAASQALGLVDADHSGGDEAWGYPWDVQTRWSHYRSGTPNVIVTSFAARALDDGAGLLGRPDLEARAQAAAGWVQRELFLDDPGAYAYHPGSTTVIHNASLLGARTAWQLGGEAARSAAMRAVERTLAAQRPDGAFPYGEGPGLEFVDSFHTGYVLECLSDLAQLDSSIARALRAGLRFYQDEFFDDSGRALLWPSQAYPEDAHSAGTALNTLSRLHEAGLDSEGLIQRVAERAVTHMVRGDHAIHRRYRWGPTRVDYVRWADAHMALGLANAALTLGGTGATFGTARP